MVSSLASQLEKIAANSINPLDIKSQRKSHSQSLLFEAGVAKTQSFETIYQLCIDGFQELCQIDSRFATFASSIFSEQSKTEDRSQMTAAQNEELDQVIEGFLGLVGARLLLKPAIKTVEWIIRRFRVHEQNTTCLILSFLPYHTTPIFASLLSILPVDLPLPLRFLKPYVESLSNPPRHTIIQTAIGNQAFFRAFTNHVLKNCRKRQQYPGMISHWSSVAVEAISGMLDNIGTGRREVRRQKEEDVLIKILPVLNEGLAMKQVADMQLGCYMILTVLASKSMLREHAITAMIESVASNWTSGTMDSGLICLSVLAQQKIDPSLPSAVFGSIMKIENLEIKLKKLSSRYRVEKLALGLVLGCMEKTEKMDTVKYVAFVQNIIEGKVMDDISSLRAMRFLITTTNSMSTSGKVSTAKAATSSMASLATGTATQTRLADLILRLAESTSTGDLMKEAIADTQIDMDDLRERLDLIPRFPDMPGEKDDVESSLLNVGRQPAAESFAEAVARIPTRTAYEISFLANSESFVFGSLFHAFLIASKSAEDLQAFTDLPVLRKSLASTEALFISFFLRVWCGPYPTRCRVAAIQCIRDCLEDNSIGTDLQVLLPYAIYALNDPESLVRESMAHLVLALSSSYARKSNSHGPKTTDQPAPNHGEIYGQNQPSKQVAWLATKNAQRFLLEVLIPNLEECRLDHTHIARLVPSILQGSRHREESSNQKVLKTSFRTAIFSFFVSHILHTPSYALKLRLLGIFNCIGRVGDISRTKAMLTLLSSHEKLSMTEIHEICSKERLDPTHLCAELVNIVVPKSVDGILTLQHIVIASAIPPIEILRKAAMERLRQLWTSLSSDLQTTIAMALMTTIFQSSLGSPASSREDASGLLHSVSLDTPALLALLQQLPKLSDHLNHASSASKRRRTSDGHIASDPEGNRTASEVIQQITTFLELLDDAPEKNIQLLPGLFSILADIQHYHSDVGLELAYVQALVLGSLNTVVKDIKVSKIDQLDPSIVRADLAVDCLMGSTSPQVQHASLLLISSLARAAPNVVVNSVMPIFTFMGSSVLRQGDDYAAHVIDQTIDSVIPPLMEALRKEKTVSLVEAAELLLSFVAAFEHIPPHRRLGLFSSLINKLGPDEFLFALLAMLVDRHGENAVVMDFAAELAGQFKPLVQCETVKKYLDIILDSLKSQPVVSRVLLSFEPSRSRPIAARNLVSFLPKVLRNTALISQISRLLSHAHQDAPRFREIYSEVLQRAILLSEETSSSPDLSICGNDLLDALLSMLDMQESVNSLVYLMNSEATGVRRQVLKSLEHRVVSSNAENPSAPIACLSLLPELTSLLEKTTNKSIRRASVGCTERIIEKYGKKGPRESLRSLEMISSLEYLDGTDIALSIMALLCLSTAVDVLGELVVPILPGAVPRILDLFEKSFSLKTQDESLYKAVYSFFSSLLLSVPYIMAGGYLDQLLILSNKNSSATLSGKCATIRLEFLNLVANQIPAPDCFSTLENIWESATIGGTRASEEFVTLLGLSIDKQPKSVVTKYSSLILDIFLQVLDIRASRGDDIGEVEKEGYDAFIRMVYKLNDTRLRPLFSKTLEWATATTGPKDHAISRQIAWFGLLQVFFSSLKSIVTSYASFLIDPAVEILRSVSQNDRTKTELCHRTLAVLQSCFTHDQDGFWQSPSHFDPISTPLIALLPESSSFPDIVPAITSLAAAGDASVHHKALNSGILVHMRSEHPSTRRAAFQCERSLTAKLGEEWLALLPEMLPFISEGMEDDDEEVENEVRMWIKEIEAILGERLDGMLQ